ncbi:MAG TPA: hypothetical protein VFO80_06845, partial [Sphingomonas sp.]|nr:hypothetical protein [Sphingomonas sp.]
MAGLHVDRRRALVLGLGGGAALALPGWAVAQDGDAWLDPLIGTFMTRFDVPGAAVAIVRKGAAPLVRGYGVRTMGKPARVDAHTRFGIA